MLFLAYFQYAYVRALSVCPVSGVALRLSMGLADLARLWLDRQLMIQGPQWRKDFFVTGPSP